MNRNKETKHQNEQNSQTAAGQTENGENLQDAAVSSADSDGSALSQSGVETNSASGSASSESAAQTAQEDEGKQNGFQQINEADELKNRITSLEKENTELKDQYLRKVADFDNYRKRMMREKQEAFDYANTNILTDLVAILDDFDRALAAADPSSAVQLDAAAIADGVKMINKQMRGLLEAKYSLASYGTAGDVFDHDKHEAIASVPSSVAEPVCAEVYLKGYMLKDRIIRPAKVLVHMPDGTAK